MWSALPMLPMVARHSELMRRISPDGIEIWAHLPSRAATVALVPALRQNLKIEILPMDHDMIMTGTIDKLLHDLDREVFAKADHVA